jgi:hypothetical protein
MKKQLLSLGLVLLILMGSQVKGQQRTCATMDKWTQTVQNDPTALARRQTAEHRMQAWLQNPQNAASFRGGPVTIPVVVHVVYKTANQNVSNAQIQSQITVLNEDFRAMNADILPISHPFGGVVADCNIEFCLATVDPQGNPTTGITRTVTAADDYAGSNQDDVKFTSAGGQDNWDPTRYLNIWVCNLGNQLLGYATFPDELTTSPDLDGVVVNYTAFGVGGTSIAPNDLGRTATHEIGHWLFLYHIWGDANCGDDLVSDTDLAEAENYGCPSFPSNSNNSCGGGPNGEMFMNYMDYVDDNCMNMFTVGQGNRMQSSISNFRSGLLTSGGCSGSVDTEAPTPAATVTISPNPGSGLFQIQAQQVQGGNLQVNVFNSQGQAVQRHEQVQRFPFQLDLSGLASDLYLVQVSNGKTISTHKVILQH